ncbi:hypothetical protein DTO96_101354 [Ephemeroptericola cinctiostellae]|uniref:Uncharacterized protein n=1 Tax=Ephemeroptericola cinctiostellae TaxID=2268024 RepID=A0A345DB85_9BURK|nr:DUF2069 domain-containing protein [Ephemeroptericola cinctiostellae]AXF85623.1 hypothetical protein DTO96_101354 [Ephemeroptericola cinctiostellae]
MTPTHTLHNQPALNALARKTTYLSIALFILCVVWETVGAPLKHGAGYWMALKGILFLPLLTKLWRGERYAYQVFSLLSLLYVLEGLLRTFSDATPSKYFAIAELLMSTFIFIWVNQFAYRTKAPKPQKEKKTRKMSGLLYVAMIVFAINLTLPSADNPMMGTEDQGYIQFKTALQWITIGLVVPYMLIIGFYRVRSGRDHTKNSHTEHPTSTDTDRLQ